VLAGFSLEDDGPEDARLERLRPPVFWGRDPGDPVIPQSAVDRTDAWLPTHSTLTKREYPGVGHSISRDELDDVNAFLNS
jgi:phospholipase/carboxylesterase